MFVGAELAVSACKGFAELAVLASKSRYVLMSQFEAVTQGTARWHDCSCSQRLLTPPVNRANIAD